MSTTEATSSLFALVEALHPDGAAAVPSDVIISRDASQGAVRRLADALAPNSIAWIAVRPGGRRRARRRLRRAGLRVSGSWLALPLRSPRALVPIEGVSSTIRSTIGGSLPVARRWRVALRTAGTLLEEAVPGVGLVVQTSDSKPALAWLADVGSAGPVAVSSGWHDPGEGLVLHGTRVVVKSSRPGARRDPSLEGAALRQLGGAAREAGALVPDVLYEGTAGRRLALAEAVVPGNRAAELLRERPARLASFLGEVAEWLARWHEGTRLPRPFSDVDIERLVLAPGRAVAPLFAGGQDYVDRLAELGRAHVGRTMPFAAAHNDLTTWNILIGSGRLAVVDWEVAEREAPPLVDLEYAMVDAVAAARGTTHDDSFVRLAASGEDAALVEQLRQKLRERLGVEAGTAELARHACWLGHARNEADRPKAGSPRPFLAIVEALAAA
jgi:hypothetical protein